MNNLQKPLSNLMQKLAPVWAADALDPKHNFLPKPIFDRWASGAAYRQMSGYPIEDFTEHYPLWFIPILQKYWRVKGELICFVWGWWWVVESEVEKEYREQMEAMRNV